MKQPTLAACRALLAGTAIALALSAGPSAQTITPLATVASGVAVTPTGGISATNVQAALAELDTEKAAISSFANTLPFSSSTADLISNQTAWTPVLTFATPGDLNVVYGTQLGRYVRLSNNMVLVQVAIVTTTFTFTSAMGNLEITGVPFTSQNTTGLLVRGGVSFGGINKAGYSQCALGMGVNVTFLSLNCSGMGVAANAVAADDTPTGGTVTIFGEVIIFL